MRQLAARRSADQLHTVAITSPWQAPTPVALERVATPAAEVPALPASPPPPTVPAGARLLRVHCPHPLRRPALVHAAAPTRTVVRAEYHPEVGEVPEVPPADEVPGQDEEEVPEGDRDVPDPDPLIEQARKEFGTEVPGGVARLKVTYGIGQKRAQHIRDALALGGKK